MGGALEQYKIDNLSVVKSVFHPIDSNMYVIVEDGSALVVDPHVSEDVLALLKENKVTKIDIILTHEHPDHTSGVNWLQDEFGAKLICHEECAAYIADEYNNRPILISFILSIRDQENGTNEAENFNREFKSYVCHADIVFKENMLYKWNEHELKLIATPGHSKGSCCIILDDKLVFTGDSLIHNTPTITRFPGGSTKDYNNITLPFLKSLDKNMRVLAGHGDLSKIGNFFE